MSNSSAEKFIWVGTANEEDVETLKNAFPDKPIAFFETLLEAGSALAAGGVVLIVDGDAERDWGRIVEALTESAPHVVRIVRVDRWDHPAVEYALAAGFDAVHVPRTIDVNWRLTIRLAFARARARYRMNAEAEYRAFFEKTPVPAAILDEEGTPLGANAAMIRSFGFSLEEIRRLKFGNQLFAEDQQEGREEIRKVLRGERDSYSMDLEWRRRDGNSRWVNLLVFRPGRGVDSGRTFAVITDISERKQTDVALQDRERYFKSIFEHTAVGISVIQVTENWLEINPALQKMLGAPAQISAQRMMEMTHPEDRFLDAELYGEMVSGLRDSYQIEKRYIHPETGEIIHGLATISLQRGADGAPQTVFGTLIDIGNVKKAQSELTAAQERLEQVLAVSPTVIYTEEIDDSSESSYWVDESRRPLGASEGHAFGEAWQERIHPSDLQLLQSSRDGDETQKVIEYRVLQGDGSYRWIRDEQKRVRRDAIHRVDVVGSMTDITESKEMENILRLHERSIRELHSVCSSPDLDTEEQFRTLLQLGRERFCMESGAILRKDGEMLQVQFSRSPLSALDEGNEVRIRDAFCSGPLKASGPVAIDEVKGTRWAELKAYERLQQEAYMGTPIMVDGEVYGSICFLDPLPRSKPFNSSDTDFLQLIAQWIGGEIERERGEKALLESQKQLMAAQKLEAVGRLTGGIAHDFNNLVMAIRGNVKLLLADKTLSPEARAELHEIDHASDQTRRLVTQLLSFSRKHVVTPEVVELGGLVEGMKRMLSRVAGENLALELDLVEGGCHTRADRSQLEQVLMNLVVNARDATEGVGTVRIATRETVTEGRPEVVLSVSDSGSGMDEATLAKIFEPFFTTKEVGKGTGLGLATVYGIVQQCSGRIEVNSAVGKGTTFRIYLPRVEPEIEMVAEPEVKAPMGSETVLLVEDTDMIRKLTRRMLERAGYHVLETRGGEEAIELCRRFSGRIHLLLTDLAMPGMNGKQVAAKVRELRPDVQLLLMSGYVGEENPSLFFGEEEMGSVLQKPVEYETLCWRIRELLDRRPTGREPAVTAGTGN